MRALIGVFLGAFFFGAGCIPDARTVPSPEADRLPTIDDGATVVVDEAWRACEGVEDCLRVSTSCDGCCAEAAITAELADAFNRAFASTCEDYVGGVCDCAPAETEVDCVEDLCVLVPVE